MFTSVVLGALIGAVLGLTGAGGGILAVPALAFGLGLPMQQAAPIALVAVAVSAAFGAWEGHRQGWVRYKAAALMAVCSWPFAYMGQWLAHQLSQTQLITAFAVVMLFVAYRMHRQTPSTENAKAHPCKVGCVDGVSGKFHWTLATGTLIAGIGAITGTMTGLLGVGGGFVIVPLLRRYTHVPMQGIVATSLLVIALTGTGSVLLAAHHGIALPPATTVAFTAATTIGMLIARQIARHLPARQLHAGFAYLLAGVAFALLVHTTAVAS